MISSKPPSLQPSSVRTDRRQEPRVWLAQYIGIWTYLKTKQLRSHTFLALRNVFFFNRCHRARQVGRRPRGSGPGPPRHSRRMPRRQRARWSPAHTQPGPQQGVHRRSTGPPAGPAASKAGRAHQPLRPPRKQPLDRGEAGSRAAAQATSHADPRRPGAQAHKNRKTTTLKTCVNKICGNLPRKPSYCQTRHVGQEWTSAPSRWRT